jgi:hypothetical protein
MISGMETEKQTLWQVTWPDGTTSKGRSATELLVHLGARQWSPIGKQEMKALLSKRAQTWSSKFIHPAQPDEPFLRELHRVGLFDLTVNGEKLGREDA